MGGLTNDTFSGMPEMLDFSKSLIEAYRKMVMRPYIKAELQSSGGYLIFGGSSLLLDV